MAVEDGSSSLTESVKEVKVYLPEVALRWRACMETGSWRDNDVVNTIPITKWRHMCERSLGTVHLDGEHLILENHPAPDVQP